MENKKVYNINAMRPVLLAAHEQGNRRMIDKKLCSEHGVSEGYFQVYKKNMEALFEAVSAYARAKNSPKAKPSEVLALREAIFPLWRDILVYPQQVSGATVNTDQEEYTNWLYGLEDAVFNALKMQGHSHVDMGVSPSSVDLTHQSEILSQLEGDMFYIFMIWNKRLEHTIKIYDLGSNTLYEDEDIQLVCPDLEDFLTQADQMVKKKSSAPAAKSKKSSAGYSAYSGYPYYPAAKDDPYGYGDFDDDFEDSCLPRKSARYTY